MIVYLLLCLINLWELRRAYLANGGGNGSGFLVRFFAMDWVIGLRGGSCGFDSSLLADVCSALHLARGVWASWSHGRNAGQ